LGGVRGDRLGIDGIFMVANVALLRARPLLSDFAFQLERRLVAELRRELLVQRLQSRFGI
jgi:hypothetical protein